MTANITAGRCSEALVLADALRFLRLKAFDRRVRGESAEDTEAASGSEQRFLEVDSGRYAFELIWKLDAEKRRPEVNIGFRKWTVAACEGNLFVSHL